MTKMDTQEGYFQNSLGHPSLPTALFFLADRRALIRSISRGMACCSAEDSLHLSWLKPLGRRPCREGGPPQSLQLGHGPTPVHGMWPHGKPVSEMTCGRMVVESLWLQWPVAAGCGKPVAA